MSKKARAQVLLADPNAPRVASPAALRAFLEDNDCAIPQRTFTQLLWEWAQAGVVDKINAHVYLNMHAQPRPRPDEAAQHLRPNAIVSTTRVLGDVGVLNNPTHFVTCVMPIELSRKSGTVAGPVHTFVFSAMPERLLPTEPTDVLHELCVEPGFYRRSTPEKAAVDLVYLAHQERSGITLPGPQDWDWSLLCTSRLTQIVEQLGLQAVWNEHAPSIGAPLIPTPAPRRPR